jgi:uncharacterized protein (TIGR02186 family)
MMARTLKQGFGRRSLASLLLVVASWLSISCVPSASGQGLVTDISKDIVDLRYDFAGADLLLFGAVSDMGGLSDQIDIVVSITGPTEDMRVRKKERVGGLWINHSAAIIRAAPGYYALSSTRPLEEISAQEALSRLALGADHLPLDIDLAPSAERMAFREGFIRNMVRAGLYRLDEDRVSLIGQTLFRTAVRLPSNVPEGLFDARVVVFADGVVIAEDVIDIAVGKTGFERAVYQVARNDPAIYGLSAVLIALLAGWAAGFLSRR